MIIARDDSPRSVVCVSAPADGAWLQCRMLLSRAPDLSHWSDAAASLHIPLAAVLLPPPNLFVVTIQSATSSYRSAPSAIITPFVYLYNILLTFVSISNHMKCIIRMLRAVGALCWGGRREGESNCGLPSLLMCSYYSWYSRQLLTFVNTGCSMYRHACKEYRCPLSTPMCFLISCDWQILDYFCAEFRAVHFERAGGHFNNGTGQNLA